MRIGCQDAGLQRWNSRHWQAIRHAVFRTLLDMTVFPALSPEGVPRPNALRHLAVEHALIDPVTSQPTETLLQLNPGLQRPGDGREPSSMSGNIAVLYTGNLAEVAEAFAEGAGHVATGVRVLRLEGRQSPVPSEHPSPGLHDLEWADGIAFGTRAGGGTPAPELMQFVEGTEPLWRSGRLFDKAVTVFTDEPEHFAADSVLHPIYDALYRWGAVIVGPVAFELELVSRPGRPLAEGRSSLPASRLRSTQYRAVRLARLAGVLAEERGRRSRLAL